MEKRNTTWIRNVALLLVLVLISLCATAGTLARYIATYSGSDTARVAKFDVTVTGIEQGETIDLFDTLYELTGDATVSDTPETHVTGERVIAPGTGGKFQVAASGTSEVAVEYAFAFTDQTNTGGIPLEFSLDNVNFDSFDALTKTDLSGTIPAGTNANTINITLYWRWQYNADGSADASDTTLGKGAVTAPISATVDLTATFTQVD